MDLNALKLDKWARKKALYHSSSPCTTNYCPTVRVTRLPARNQNFTPPVTSNPQEEKTTPPAHCVTCCLSSAEICSVLGSCTYRIRNQSQPCFVPLNRACSLGGMHCRMRMGRRDSMREAPPIWMPLGIPGLK